jgi:hypothetical protein
MLAYATKESAAPILPDPLEMSNVARVCTATAAVDSSSIKNV